MNDESYILENKENVLLVEFPAFYDNLEEFEKYVKELNKNIVGKVFSDHPNGGTILKDVKGYASEGTINSMKEATIHNLVTGFEKSFNGAFVPVGGTYTMSFEEAAQLINEIKPQVAVPIHYGSVVGTKQDAIDFIKLLNPTINGVILMK